MSAWTAGSLQIPRTWSQTGSGAFKASRRRKIARSALRYRVRFAARSRTWPRPRARPDPRLRALLAVAGDVEIELAPRWRCRPPRRTLEKRQHVPVQVRQRERLASLEVVAVALLPGELVAGPCDLFRLVLLE